MTNKLSDREYDILRLTITGEIGYGISREANINNSINALGFDAEPVLRVHNESAQKYITILDKLTEMQIEAREETK